MKVFLYRNLHFEGHVYSVKSLEGPTKGLVIGHTQHILLENAEFIVNESGRQRVLKQKRKNVHAAIVGNVLAVNEYRPRLPSLLKNVPQWQDQVQGYNINYNPYFGNSFYIVGSNNPIKKAEIVSVWQGDIKVLTKPVNIPTQTQRDQNASNSEINRLRHILKQRR